MNDYAKGKLFEYNRAFFNSRRMYDYIDLAQVCELALLCGARLSPHKQICNEISYVISGEGVFYTDGVPMKAKQGDLHVIAAGQTHDIQADSEQNFRYICIGFDFNERLPADMRDVSDFYSSPPAQIVKARENLRFIFGMLIQEFMGENKHCDLAIEALIKQLLLFVMRSFFDNTVVPLTELPRGVSAGATVYSILQYIDHNIYDVKSVREIAKALCFNENYLSHLFKDKMGITLQRYIRMKKTEIAGVLIKGRKHTIREIADILNFDSPQSLTKAFKKEFGCTPTEYITQI